ncbi:hypothetical protein [Pseudomonas sp. TMW22091]|uniref:hypothetical protein n=1 Tax=Pseudomonas sp. TMW22091 TaxID=2506435 RepID=UPI001F10A652|nr:hypothetical protein [Pseudomonas sp. TMW22091]MCH4874904.1 hypothetical protein [Pseudomonas sp. TMW22091]
MGVLTSVQLETIEVVFKTSLETGHPVTFGNVEEKLKFVNPILAPFTLAEIIDVIGGGGGESGPDDEISYQRFLNAYNSLPKV